jgi:peptide/nickel transport system substrate-binding protein
MRRSVLRSLASVSLLLALGAAAATRPHYGGTLRIEMRAAPASLDPAQADAAASAKFVPLLFDTLVTLDDGGNPQPALARGWQARSDNRHWQFPLRPGVKFSDGSALTPAKAAASLLAANAGWRVTALDDAVILDFDTPQPHLLAELARPRNAIVVRGDNKLLGTGPYRLAEFQAGRRAVFAANDDYWGGRPFLDSIRVEMGRGYRDQVMDLDLGRADVIEIAPDQARRAIQEGRRMALSAPVDLVALQFVPGRAATEDVHLREAVALAIDRAAINNVLLQRQGEPTGALLPQWLSGYAFLFPAAADLARARELRPSSYAGLTLAYDPADPLARVLAERVALNARDAGIVMQVAASPQAADARIARFRIESSDPAAALAGLASALDPAELPRISGAASPEALYAAERGLLDDFRIVPLVDIPDIYALGATVRNWDEARAGGWPLSAVWIEPQKKDQP